MVQLCKAQQDDKDFLIQLKKRTIKDYIERTWGWDDQEQEDYFNQHFQPHKIDIIFENNQKIGMIEIEEKESDMLILNIQILPEFQNKRIGTILIKNVIGKAKFKKKELKLQVLKVNKKALKLYKNLGFIEIGETENHILMMYK